jgi:hypothetical protein
MIDQNLEHEAQNQPTSIAKTEPWIARGDNLTTATSPETITGDTAMETFDTSMSMTNACLPQTRLQTNMNFEPYPETD